MHNSEKVTLQKKKKKKKKKSKLTYSILLDLFMSCAVKWIAVYTF